MDLQEHQNSQCSAHLVWKLQQNINIVANIFASLPLQERGMSSRPKTWNTSMCRFHGRLITTPWSRSWWRSSSKQNRSAFNLFFEIFKGGNRDKQQCAT